MAFLSLSCVVVKVGGHNLHGEEVPGPRKREKCAVIDLTRSATHSSLRTDKTASVGAAEESLGAATLLLGVKTTASIGDTIVMDTGERFRVISKRARYAVSGKLDHHEVGCGIG